METLYQTYKDEGFIVMQLIAENNQSQPPTPEELAAWAGQGNATHPVLSDAGWQVTYRFATGASIALPTQHLLGRGAVVIARDTWVNESQIQAALQE